MKLNLGGRDKKIDGFLTVDLFPGPQVDVSCDISDLKQFETGSVDEIYASHCLEHFGINQTIPVLKEWHRVLKPRGKAYIAVPDFDACVKLYLKYNLQPFVRNMLWGDQGYDLAYHKTGFSFPSLARDLVEAGFYDVTHIKKMPYGLNDCSTLVDNMYGIPMSLNVEAIA